MQNRNQQRRDEGIEAEKIEVTRKMTSSQQPYTTEPLESYQTKTESPRPTVDEKRVSDWNELDFPAWIEKFFRNEKLTHTYKDIAEYLKTEQITVKNFLSTNVKDLKNFSDYFQLPQPVAYAFQSELNKLKPQYDKDLKAFSPSNTSSLPSTNTPAPGISPNEETKAKIVRAVLTTEESKVEIRAPLSPLVLLALYNEIPIPFLESLLIAYKDAPNEIILFIKNKYASLNSVITAGNINVDERAAIYFYTLEFPAREWNLYSRLNKDLTTPQREQTAPQWKHYLHYLFSALKKTPFYTTTQDLYRGVAEDLVTKYPQKYKVNNIITWYGFTSTSTKMDTVRKILDKYKKQRSSSADPFKSVIFCINSVFSGRSIKEFSGIPDEDEILLPPASRFKIITIFPLEGKCIVKQY